MSKLLWFIQFIYTNFPKYSRYRELWDGHMSNNHPLFIVPTGRPFVSLSPISNDDGGCYSRRMPVIWDPFGTSCSLKQALSSQQLTDFGLNKVPTVPIAEKDQKSQKICQKSIWQRDFFYPDRTTGLRNKNTGCWDSSPVCRKSTELAWPGRRCCFPSSSLDTGWLIPLCVWFPSRFRPTGEIVLFHVLLQDFKTWLYPLSQNFASIYYPLRSTKYIVYCTEI